MLTRGKLAEQTGCNLETIRYYERVGLLPEPARTAGGYRIYNKSHVRLLNFIQRAKSLGFTSERIRGLLELSDPKQKHTRADVKKLTDDHIADIATQIKDLQKLKRRLTQISSYCDGSKRSAEQCPILVTLFDSLSK